MELSQLTTNLDAEQNGEWRYPSGYPGLGLLVRSQNCRDFRRRVSQLMQEKGELLFEGDGETPDEEAILGLRNLAIGELLLLGWSGITDGGKAVAFSPELALEWMQAPAMRAFQEAVQWATKVCGTKKSRFEEGLAKKSERSRERDSSTSPSSRTSGKSRSDGSGKANQPSA